jgi:hypothetical protein
MRTTIQERFPTFGVVVTTSAPEPQTISAIANPIRAEAEVSASTPHEYWFRLRTDGLRTPMIICVSPPVWPAPTSTYASL